MINRTTKTTLGKHKKIYQYIIPVSVLSFIGQITDRISKGLSLIGTHNKTSFFFHTSKCSFFVINNIIGERKGCELMHIVVSIERDISDKILWFSEPKVIDIDCSIDGYKQYDKLLVGMSGLERDTISMMKCRDDFYRTVGSVCNYLSISWPEHNNIIYVPTVIGRIRNISTFTL